MSSHDPHYFFRTTGRFHTGDGLSVSERIIRLQNPTPRPCLRRIILLWCENGNFEKTYKSFKEDQFKFAPTLSPTEASFSLVFHLGSIVFPFQVNLLRWWLFFFIVHHVLSQCLLIFQSLSGQKLVWYGSTPEKPWNGVSGCEPP